MCQLFALDSNSPTAVNFSFTGFSARGGRTADHRDGWGIAFHSADGCRVFIDDAPASQSPLADFIRCHPIRATSVLAHVRKATQGGVALRNCHPFQRRWGGRDWVFGHNGNLLDFDPPLDADHRALGSTDSERAFGWLMQGLRQQFGNGPAPDWRELAPWLAAQAALLARHGPFNMLLADGQAVYSHCSTRLHWLQRQHPFSPARLVDADLALDLSRDNRPGDRMVLLATEPLTHDEPWQAMAAGEFAVFAAGQRVWHSQAATVLAQAA